MPLARHAAPIVTEALIAINVIVFLAETATGAPLGGGGGGTIVTNGVLFGPAIVHQHEYWRLVTSGFLHDGLLHILFNMLFLYFVGPMLEPAIGQLQLRRRLLRLAARGVVRRAPVPARWCPRLAPRARCFGVLGALIVVAYDRGISIWQSGLGPMLVINLVFSRRPSGDLDRRPPRRTGRRC